MTYELQLKERMDTAVSRGCIDCRSDKVDVFYVATGCYCDDCYMKAVDNNDIGPYGSVRLNG